MTISAVPVLVGAGTIVGFTTFLGVGADATGTEILASRTIDRRSHGIRVRTLGVGRVFWLAGRAGGRGSGLTVAGRATTAVGDEVLDAGARVIRVTDTVWTVAVVSRRAGSRATLVRRREIIIRDTVTAIRHIRKRDPVRVGRAGGGGSG